MVVQGKEIAWADWLALRPVLGRVFGRHCTGESEVDDILQETYLRAALYGRFAPDGKTLRPWLIRIGMNALADMRNKEGRYQSQVCEAPLSEELFSEEEALDGEQDLRIGSFTLGYEEARGLLRRTLGAVRGPDRELLDSVYREGHSTRATARCCAIPERLVKGRVYRARQRLCRAMRHRAAVEHGQ